MHISLLTDERDLQKYGTWVNDHSHGSLWQSLQWKRYQEALGRETKIYLGSDAEDGPVRASALVVIDRTSMNMSTWDLPRGPLWDERFTKDELFEFTDRIIKDATNDAGLAVYFSPSADEVYPNVPCRFGRRTDRHVYPEATIVIDLEQPEEAILSQMHQKGRYNIGLAERSGVVVEQSADIFAFYNLVESTAKRDHFRHPAQKTYETFLRTLEGSFLLLAHKSGLPKPIAGLLGVMWHGTGVYYYGASDYEQRALMAPSLIQWEAMKFCKLHGCHAYDLFGIAPKNQPDHAWAGVTDFKQKLGGTIRTYPSEQELVLRPFFKFGLDLKRKILG